MEKTNIKKDTLRKAIYEIVEMIPYGRATSYGAIAKVCGYPNLSRMIGCIMSECNSSQTGIPAHRVVNGKGVLSGKTAFGSSSQMQQLLEIEGISIVNNRIQNWKKVFWSPIDEIDL